MIYCAKTEEELYALFEKEKDARAFAGENGEIIRDRRFSIKSVKSYLQKGAIIVENSNALFVTSGVGHFWFTNYPEIGFSSKRGYYRKDLEVKL